MGGEQKPFRWIALFRDGHTIEQNELSAAERSSAFRALTDYLLGTEENPKKHYLLWFRLTDGDNDFTVIFERDGDAYIATPDGRYVMTEFKIRSANLLYWREQKEDGTTTFLMGFGGVNTAGQPDGKCISIGNGGIYKLMEVLPVEHAMMKA